MTKVFFSNSKYSVKYFIFLVFCVLPIVIFIMMFLAPKKILSAADYWDGVSGTIPNSSYTFSGGTGISTDPYIISTSEDLAVLSSNVNAGLSGYSNAHYILGDNIYLNNENFIFYPDSGLIKVTDETNVAYIGSGIKGDDSGLNSEFDLLPSLLGQIYTDEFDTLGTYEGIINTWVPIGTNTNQFKGTFNGNGYSVVGMYINNENPYLGLFGTAGSESNVSNINVYKSFINGSYFIGSVSGRNYGTINNCTSSTIVLSSAHSVGGVVGANQGNIIKSNSNNIVHGIDYVGGIAGSNHINSGISKSTNYGNIYGSNYIGGIVGSNGETAIVHSCTNTGDINGMLLVGGLVGSNDSKLVNSVNNGSVTGSNKVGGVIGSATASSNTLNVYNSGIIIGDYYIGSVIGEALGAHNYCYYLNDTASDNTSTVQYAIGTLSAGSNISDISPSTTGFSEYGVLNSDVLVGIYNGNKINSVLRYWVENEVDNSIYYTWVHNYLPALRERVYFDSGNGTSANPYTISRFEQLQLLADIFATGEGGYFTNGGPFVEFASFRESHFELQNNISVGNERYSFDSDTGLIRINDGINEAYMGTGILGDESGSNSVFDINSSVVGRIYEDNKSTTIGKYYGNYSNWLPIGSNSSPFAGVFNGNGYYIFGMYQVNSDTQRGLFGVIANANISNITMDSSLVVGREKIGSLVGEAINSHIENISIDSYIISTVSNAGGIVGYVEGTTIDNCNNDGLVASGSNNAGGIAGGLMLSSSIKNSHNSGSIYSAKFYSGGLTGRTNSSVIINSYNSGTVRGKQFTGGLVGQNWSTTIDNSYNSGTVFGTNSVGGVVGANYLSTLSNNYNVGNVKGSSYSVGGIVGSKYTGSVVDCYYLNQMNYDGNNVEQFGIGNTQIGSQTIDIENSTTGFNSYGQLNMATTINSNQFSNLLGALNEFSNTYNDYFDWNTYSFVNNDFPIHNECYLTLDINVNTNETLEGQVVSLNNGTNNYISQKTLFNTYKVRTNIDNYNIYINNINTTINISTTGFPFKKIQVFSVEYDNLYVDKEYPSKAFYGEGAVVEVWSGEGILEEGYTFIGFNTDSEAYVGLETIDITNQEVFLVTLMKVNGFDVELVSSSKTLIFGESVLVNFTHENKDDPSSTVVYEWVVNGEVVSNSNEYIPLANSSSYTIICKVYFTYAGTTQVSSAGDNYLVNKKEITISEIVVSDKTYDGNTDATISEIGNLIGLVTNYDDVTLSNTEASFLNSESELNKTVNIICQLVGSDSNNYYISSIVTIASITAKELTINWYGNEGSTTNFNWVYNNTSIAPTATVTTGVGVEELDLIVSGSKVNASSIAYLASATLSEANSNYTLENTTKEFYIDKADYDMSMVSLSDETYVYDGLDHSLVINGILPTGLDGIQLEVTYSGSAKDVSDGLVSVVATFNTTSINYNTPVALSANVSITAKELTINWYGNEGSTTNFNWVYNNTSIAPTATVTTGVGVEELDLIVSGSKVNASSIAYLASATLSEANSNYTLENTTKEFYIDKADYDMSMVSLSDETYVYDGLDHSLVINGILPTGLDGIQLEVTYSGSAKDVSDGLVSVVATFNTTSINYNTPVALSANVSITAKELTINWYGNEGSATNFNWVYNNTSIAPTATVTTGVGVEELDLIVSGSKVNASSIAYLASATLSEANSNYTLENTTKEFYIDKADYDMSMVSLSDETYVYDGLDHSLVINGILPTGLDGIQLEVTYSGSAKDVSDGLVSVVATFNTTSINYNTPVALSANVSITAKELTINWYGNEGSTTNFNWVYNNTSIAPTATVTTGVGVEELDLIVSGSKVNASSIAYLASATLSEANSNYTLENTTKEFYIDKADYDMSMVSLSDETYVYDGLDHSLVINGILPTGLDGIQLEVTYSGSAKDVSDGLVSVVATFNTTSINYNTPVALSANVSITAKELTINWYGNEGSTTNFNWVYNNTSIAPTATVTTGVGVEELDLIVSGSKVNASSIAYLASATLSEANSNYTLENTTKEFYIDKADYDMSMVSLSDETYVYDGLDHSLVINGILPTGLDGIQLEVTYSGSAKDVSDGLVSVVATFNTTSINYNTPVALSANVSITAKELTINWYGNEGSTTNFNWVYNNTSIAPTATVTTGVGVEELDLIVSGSKVNASSIAYLASATLSEANSNYTLENTTKEFYIDKADYDMSMVSLSDETYVYDGLDHSLVINGILPTGLDGIQLEVTYSGSAKDVSDGLVSVVATFNTTSINYNTPVALSANVSITAKELTINWYGNEGSTTNFNWVYNNTSIAPTATVTTGVGVEELDLIVSGSKVNASSIAYLASATLSEANSNYTLENTTKEFYIDKADYDMSMVSLSDETYVYDGLDHSLVINGILPTGLDGIQLEVTYSGSAKDVSDGLVSVVATFNTTSINYNTPVALSANVSITAKELTINWYGNEGSTTNFNWVYNNTSIAPTATVTTGVGVEELDLIVSGSKVNASSIAYLASATLSEANSNYTLENTTKEFYIDKADYDMSMVSLSDETYVYDGLDHSLVINGILPTGLDGIQLEVTYSGSAKDVSDGLVSVVATFNTTSINYNTPVALSANVSITAKELTINWYGNEGSTTNFNWVYNNTSIAPTATVTTGVGVEELDLIVSGSKVNASSIAYLASATLSEANSNYTLENTTKEFYIDKADYDMSMVSLSDETYVYDGLDHSLVINGILPTGLDGIQLEVTYSGSAKDVSDGLVSVVATFNTTSINYNTPVALSANVSITAKELTINWYGNEGSTTNFNWVYNNTSIAPTATVTTGVGVEELDLIVSGSKVNASSIAYLASATLSEANSNYTLENTTKEFYIDKADYDMSMVSLSDETYVYDGLDHSLVINGILPTGLDGIQLEVTYSGSAKDVSDGLVSVVATFNTTSINYNTPVALSANVSITAKELTINWYGNEGSTTNFNWVYNNTSIAPTATVTTGVGVEELDLIVSGSKVNASSIAYLASATLSEANSNYTLENTTKEFYIDKADYDMSMVSLSDETYVYDGLDHSLVINGILPTGLDGIQLEVTYSGSAKDVSDGLVSVVATFNTTSINYNTPVALSANVSITAKELTINWYGNEGSTTNFNWVYNNTSIAPTATVTTGVGVEELDLIVSGSKVNASSIAYLASATLSEANSNYTLENTTKEFYIDKADYDMSMVSLSDETYVYDGLDHSLVINGILPTGLDGIQLEVTYSGSAKDVSDGLVSVVATFNTTSINYNTPVALSANVSITAKELTINWYGNEGSTTNFNWVYNNTSIAPTATVTTGVGVEELDLIVSGSKVNASSIAYLASATLSEANSNYTLENTTKEFYIDKADYDMSMVSLSDETYVYDGLDHSLVINGILPTGLDGIQLEVTYSGSAKDVSDGLVSVVATFNTTSINYNTPVALSANVSITAKEVELEWILESDSLEYDKTAKIVKAVVKNVIETDECLVSVSLTPNNDNINTGVFTYTAISLNNNNYTLNNCEKIESGGYEITPKKIQLIISNVETTELNIDVEMTYEVIGLCEGDSFSGFIERESGSRPGKYCISIGTLSNSNYIIECTDGVYVIKRVYIETLEKIDNTNPLAFAYNKNGVDPDAELILKHIDNKDLSEKIKSENINGILIGYTLELFINDTFTILDGEWTISIFAPTNLSEGDDVNIIVIENGVEVLKEAKVEDGYISLNLNSNELLVILDSNNLLILITLILILVLLTQIAIIYILSRYIRKSQTRLVRKKGTV